MYRKILLFLIIFACIYSCASIPPQTVTSQELVLKGLQTSKNNQLALIEAYAADQISRKEELMSNAVIDKVINDQMNGRNALPPEEIKMLILEYEKDITSERNNVNIKKEELKQITLKNYDALEDLAKLNLEYMKSLQKTTAWQKNLMDKYDDELKSIQEKFEGLLK